MTVASSVWRLAVQPGGHSRAVAGWVLPRVCHPAALTAQRAATLTWAQRPAHPLHAGAAASATADQPSNAGSSAGGKASPPGFARLELMIADRLGGGPGGDWKELEGCFVLQPPEGAPPMCLVHFIGGSFVGAAPQLAYRPLLEALAARGALQAGGARHCRWQAVFRCRAAAGGGGDDSGSGSTIPDMLPVAGIDSDWRKFRAQLVASIVGSSASSSGVVGGIQADAAWAHPLPHPEHGCLLLANPLMFTSSQQYFHMSVILVWAYDSRGSAGLILNRPTEYTVSHFGQGAGFLTPEFDRIQLYLGGDVGTDTVHLLHGVPGLDATSEIIPGVYLGGFQDAKRSVAEGKYDPDQFKILTRYAGWGPGQLESECARGVWLPVSASKHAVLRWTESPASVADMWHYVAQLAGGDLAALSREVLGVADPDISKAAGGGYAPKEDEESEGSSGGSVEPGQHIARARWQQQRRRRRSLPEADYRDGAGI